ncbi:MAG: helix-turn-helix transcriptional regulator [Clostridia bacterium]|nr:helix-turn-helix transcriptional regulator [Clostridia bacterium]
MENINDIIGQNLLKLRKQKKLTQLELADKFNYSDKAISKWEKGESLPSIDVLNDLAKFYDVTLDSLVSDEDITAAPRRDDDGNKRKSNYTSFVITLLALSGVWLCATALYVALRLTLNIGYIYCFFWAVPLSCVVLLVFNSIWGSRKYLFPILTALLWSTLACTHIQVLAFNIDIWPIMFIGIPLQVGILLWGALLIRPRKKKNLNESSELDEEKPRD